MNLRNLLILGVFVELAILLISNNLFPALEETARYSARYSGRLSAIVFLIAFYFYASSKSSTRDIQRIRKSISLFALLHLIHLGFLAANVHLNDIPLEAHKLVGGALAYLMIVLAPLLLFSVKKAWQIFYYYYVSFVMIMTYVARAKGDFEGAEAHTFHFVALGIYTFACLLFGFLIYRNK